MPHPNTIFFHILTHPPFKYGRLLTGFSRSSYICLPKVVSQFNYTLSALGSIFSGACTPVANAIFFLIPTIGLLKLYTLIEPYIISSMKCHLYAAIFYSALELMRNPHWHSMILSKMGRRKPRPTKSGGDECSENMKMKAQCNVNHTSLLFGAFSQNIRIENL